MIEDLSNDKWPQEEHKKDVQDNHLIIALTGDLTEEVSSAEVSQVEKFFSTILRKTILGQEIDLEHIFMVPGNHDIIYQEEMMDRRWQPYCALYQNLFQTQTDSKKPQKLNRVRDYSNDFGVIVAELNSCTYVYKNSPEAQRGRFDEASYQVLYEQLQNIPKQNLDNSIKIALIHHHPVVLPQLAEPGRGYDAILSSESLLNLLQKFGFQIILHGHKHTPHTFLYDAVSAWTLKEPQPIKIIAGGSVSSNQLIGPNPNACNTYNLITIKWNTLAKQGRIKIVTRGLVRHDEEKVEMPSCYWYWKTIRSEDGKFSHSYQYPKELNVREETFDLEKEECFENRRINLYSSLRGNMPVVEVVPSIMPGQAYEARLWIVPHNRSKEQIPIKVVWSGGSKFPLAVCENPNSSDTEKFAASFSYWSDVLIQARIYFQDGTVGVGYVYARIPT